MSTTRIVFFTSRMIAMMLMVALALSLTVFIFAVEPYIPKLLNRPQSQPPGTATAGESIAPVPWIEFSVPVYVDTDVKTDDPWGASAGLLFNFYRFECLLPNRVGYGIANNATHTWYYCVFRPDVSSGNAFAWMARNGTVQHIITEISWTNLDTARNYRYTVAWPRSTVTQTINHPQLGLMRITAAVLPDFPVHDGGTTALCTSMTHQHRMFNNAVELVGFTASQSFGRYNSTDIYILSRYTFTQSLTVTRIEYTLSCGGGYTNYLVHRVEFVDSAGNPRQVTFQAGDIIVIDKYIRLRSS